MTDNRKPYTPPTAELITEHPALAYMRKQAESNRAKLERARRYGAPEKDIENIEAKASYYEAAALALEKEAHND